MMLNDGSCYPTMCYVAHPRCRKALQLIKQYKQKKISLRKFAGLCMKYELSATDKTLYMELVFNKI